MKMRAIDNDPFAIFTAPPRNETPEQKCIRQQREEEEKRVSDRIDEEIKAERVALKKQKAVVKVLLLGQSESGKSTTLKNFRMKYARAAWKAERLSWRSVIQLNLIRSIITIMETLQAELDNLPIAPLPAPLPVRQDDYLDSSIPRRSMDSEFLDSDADASQSPVLLTDRHHLLRLRLSPLRSVEEDLKRQLGAGTEEITSVDDVAPVSPTRAREFGVRGWKNVFEGPLAALNGRSSMNDDRNGSEALVNAADDVTEVIARCREDMKALWEDEDVKAVLRKRRIRLEESAGFFLDDLDRIATHNYEPSDDDIVRARLRTLGVQEYRIQFDQSPSTFLGNVGFGGDYGQEWIIYDVGGSRTARKAWIPYFEAVNAIIFLAPISCFDERLLEDTNVNRLEDSFLLWRAVCGSKILAKTTIILFLNKCDLLKKKLRSGAEVKTFLPSYGERPNESSAVVKYLKEKFKDTLRQESPESRVSYFYATSVTDTKATATTLKAVRDSILREHLKNADFV